jgi:site-specific recombinase XerD
MSTFSVRFYLHLEKTKADGTAPIYARITVNGKRARISLKRWIHPRSWNNERGYAKGTTEQARALNAYVDTHRAKIWEAYQALVAEGRPVSADRVKNVFAGNDGQTRTLVEVFQYHNQQIRDLVGQTYAKGTLSRYETTLAHVREFMKHKYKVSDISLTELDYHFISAYDHFLRTVRGCANNSAVKYIRNLRKIVNLALRSGWIDRDPFVRYRASVKEVKRGYLTQEELQAIESKEITNRRLAAVKDVFVFSCYTGLAYVDVANLSAQHLVKGIDGNDWIIIDRTKTGTPSRIPLLPPAEAVLTKYKDDPVCATRGKLLPVGSNQRMNAYLKEIGAICGIEKNLTFHLARHTFATTVTLTNGVPIESVSAILGHRSIRTTQIYAKVIDQKISRDMNALRSKLR